MGYLYLFLISKFIDIYLSLHTLAPPGDQLPSARGTRIVSTQRAIEVYEMSHYPSSPLAAYTSHAVVRAACGWALASIGFTSSGPVQLPWRRGC